MRSSGKKKPPATPASPRSSLPFFRAFPGLVDNLLENHMACFKKHSELVIFSAR